MSQCDIGGGLKPNCHCDRRKGHCFLFFIGSNLIKLSSEFSEIVIYILLARTQLYNLVGSKNRKTHAQTGIRT